MFIVASMALTACASWRWWPPFPFAPRARDLAGTWANKFKLVWIIHENGTFEVDADHDGKTDVSGIYHLRGHEITLRETSGKVPADCEGAGVYRFRLHDGKLSFQPVRDACVERTLILSAAWHRKWRRVRS